ncbi:MAG: hypothetical protein K0S63_350 [Gammaproteobacteria bacterium]|jgi:hypothetical protein|nr:hypothetical protein [Gammaproteobacteria bacterium]
MKNYLKITAALLAVSTASMAFAEGYTCPTLTASDIQNTINSGYVFPDKQFGSEFYYVFANYKNVDNKTYVIAIGEVMGKDITEVRERAKKIVSTDEKSFEGVYWPQLKGCLYNKIWDASIIPDYPVGADKIVALVAKEDDGEPLVEPSNLFMKK